MSTANLITRWDTHNNRKDKPKIETYREILNAAEMLSGTKRGTATGQVTTMFSKWRSGKVSIPADVHTVLMIDLMMWERDFLLYDFGDTEQVVKSATMLCQPMYANRVVDVVKFLWNE